MRPMEDNARSVVDLPGPLALVQIFEMRDGKIAREIVFDMGHTV